ncbi:pantoate--beta-alanine ligase [Stackebrandtia nassauensis]|uniref:Pantothenate synthetase n=1 Tax=Stackebrandtia nassauensis (strain DSM 44728 / CIP 108903 / NRRL B-16338 / NBRC 102104 / LLR-40K-21) TaxID=446470 RepID=D3Q0E7_STANL|nr:pantoate--beta-alanine ligase [Stackebrandtia nassauensis]ADD39811.1 pantoate/beta-alanine ligase [Stackebrandtia nassauensis DSM 44728]
MTVRVVATREELAKARAELSGTVALVPTMGALHDGHVANIRAAKARADTVVVSIFVNPLQFGPNEDFEKYPRPLSADLELCAAEGVDLVFAPNREVVYPHEVSVTVDPGPLGEILEGASRPGFFRGVLTVVSKLFHLVRPDFACFGEKDYQQLTLVRRLVSDLDFPLEIVPVPTVRESDGLARSSRNVYLDTEQRAVSLAISRALKAAADSPDPLAAAREVLDAAPGIALDYLALTDPALGPAPETGAARLLIAAKVGTTRLIDNTPVHIGVK